MTDGYVRLRCRCWRGSSRDERVHRARHQRSSARNVNVYYGDKHALKDVNVDIPERAVMAFIGPSGCGKSTFLRCINRMNDTIADLPRDRQDR